MSPDSVECAKRFLRAVIMADPTFPVSVDFFSGICTQSSWLIPRSHVSVESLLRYLDAAFMADAVVVPLVACSPEWSLPISDVQE